MSNATLNVDQVCIRERAINGGCTFLGPVFRDEQREASQAAHMWWWPATHFQLCTSLKRYNSFAQTVKLGRHMMIHGIGSDP